MDARVSDDLEDVGSCRPQKFIRLFKCILQAWWLRLRHGPMAFYYVPAPAKRSAIMRDWVVMALCRPLFPELILHWHAYGLGEWAELGRDWQRRLTRLALGKADLSIVLNNYNKRDAEVFAPKRIEVVPNGIADLFPDYETALALRRKARAATLKSLQEQMEEHEGGKVAKCERMKVEKWEPESHARGAETAQVPRERDEGSVNEREGMKVERLERVRFLFLGHLIETKGVFVAIEATGLANEDLRKSNAPWRAHLTLAGSFASGEEKVRVLASIAQANKAAGDDGPCVTLAGFLDAGQKKAALDEADCLVFATFYEGETQGLVLLEAMSSGLPVITTSWRGVPEVLPEGYPGVVEPMLVETSASIMLARPLWDYAAQLRRRCLERFTIRKHLEEISSRLILADE